MVQQLTNKPTCQGSEYSFSYFSDYAEWSFTFNSLVDEQSLPYEWNSQGICAVNVSDRHRTHSACSQMQLRRVFTTNTYIIDCALMCDIFAYCGLHNYIHIVVCNQKIKQKQK